MKKLFSICLLLAAMMSLAGVQVKGQQAQNNKAEQEVRKVERQWLDAYTVASNGWCSTRRRDGRKLRPRRTCVSGLQAG